jgi:hypothetical protein
MWTRENRPKFNRHKLLYPSDLTDGEWSHEALCLLRAHHQRDLLGFFDVIDLGGKIQSPQRHAEREPEPGRDAVAIADARPRLRQVQLEQADLVGRGRVDPKRTLCRLVPRRCAIWKVQPAFIIRRFNFEVQQRCIDDMAEHRG